ncbi:CFE protein [Cucumis melo var. makuwa]|uniref:Uncharacterized protein LOC103486014 n=2 Tax=Cucumis melo TaxID=3656 RepID=A0A1S4E2T8_CUCME|nr:uncharacterized protein LOC103486014 [Cucumis melo]KAA0056946.1 CFE protein [Cucumis melo var. makuwa]TYK26373.1 CFE protein [Cucumis melo var. makuwa]
MAWLLSLKATLMSAGVISMALALKVSVPLVFEFSVLYVPLIWNSLISCLRPPYIYIIINGIIISIVASTRFHQKEADAYVEIPSATKPSEDIGYREIVSEYAVLESPTVYEQRDELIVSEVKAIDAIDFQVEEVIAPEVKEIEAVILPREEVIAPETKVIEAISSVEAEAEDEDKFVISTNRTWNSLERMRLPEKPLVSSRFGHRKSAKASPEGGKALGVISKAKRHETLENTWKAITEGRAMPLSRHTKKWETWENQGRQVNGGEVEMKAETLKERRNEGMTSVKLRKEASMSQDDLNRRVEDFIRRFNEEMRLQREQSLKKYWEMVNCDS